MRLTARESREVAREDGLVVDYFQLFQLEYGMYDETVVRMFGGRRPIDRRFCDLPKVIQEKILRHFDGVDTTP